MFNAIACRFLHIILFMAEWKKRANSCVQCNANTLYILRLDRARAVSDFIKEVHNLVEIKKYDNITLDFAYVKQNFPNAAVPISAIINHYKSIGVKFHINNCSVALSNSQFLQPDYFNGNTGRNVLSKIWKFSTSDQVCNFVAAAITELQKSDSFYKGVLDSIEWSLNEVMDNVIQHSNIEEGYVMGQLHKARKNIAFAVADLGQGIFNSFKGSEHAPRTNVDAITLAIQEEVTRDKKIGQGNGLYGLHSIIKQGQGKLVITSGTGSYCYSGISAKNYEHLPSISKNNPGTIVDFQLCYERDMSLDQALVFRGKQYDFASIRFEEYENDNGIQEYVIKDKSEGTGTRISASRVKNDILNILTETQRPITIDFSGCSVMSSSYADELLAKLFVELGLFQFNNLIKIKGLDASMQKILQRSVLQRIIEYIGE